MWSRFRVGLSRYIINATVRLSIILGVLPYGYNARRKRIVAKNYCLIYSILIDVVLIALILYKCYREVRVYWDNIAEWSLMMALSQLVNLAHLYSHFAILWTNWKEYDSVLDMFNEFATMERSYFAKHNILCDNCATFHNYLAWWTFVMLLNNIVFFYIIRDKFTRISIYMLISFFIIVIPVNVLLVAVLQFYTVVLNIYRNIWTLQQRLIYLSSCGLQRVNVDNLMREIEEIVVVYMRLQRLSERSNSIYGKQVFLYINAIVGDNTTKTFLLLLIWKGTDFSWNNVYVFYLIVISTVEFWLIIAACELTLNAAYDFSQLLRSFNECTHLDDKSQRELEVLALFCASRKPRFRLCGLMDLDYSKGLSILLTIVLHIIYLVQTHYVVFYYDWDE
ncbi:putative gustatory receptor 22a [Bactrocera oleae]|uniref:putative gustatory receptor 22a n=1 Tax=Bactrocera oleae TaxID=104688 RepID=UPI00387EDB79